MRKLLLKPALLSLMFIPSLAVAEDVNTKVANALAGYHFGSSNAALEALAGGRDELIDSLLQLRTDDSRPFVGIRAERVLVTYADEPRVTQALLDDLGSDQRKGLARTVAIHLENAPNATARAQLGTQAVNRARRENAFRPYVEGMKSSSDSELKRIARSLD